MNSDWSRLYLLPLLFLLAAWSGWFIYQGSFLVGEERYYSLFDDAMISMTYAKNVTQGHGLNWAKFGDPVEGYTSPLWVMAMVPFQLLPVAWGKVSLFFSCFCAVILGINAILMDRILSKRLGIHALIPRIAATFSISFLFSMNFWTLTGMECGPQVLLFLLATDQFLAFEAEHRVGHLWKLGWALAAALLLRMDMVFFVGLVILFLAPWLWKNRRVALRFLLIVGTPMALYLLFRIVYFHDILPNTYYLKLYKIPLDIRLRRAWVHFSVWAGPLWLLWVLLPLAMIPLRKQKVMWLSFLSIIVYLGYNLYAGGDAWEGFGPSSNRFTIITLPWIVLVTVAGLHGYTQWLPGRWKAWLGGSLPAVPALLAFVLINGILFVPHAKKNWDTLVVKAPPFNADYQMWNVMKALSLNERFGTANRVAVVQAGDIGYFGHYELVDILGYNDAVIAKEEPYWDLYKYKVEFYIPGHAKLDYKQTIGALRPDFVADKWLKFNPDVDAEFYRLIAEGGYEDGPQGGYLRKDFVRRDR